MLCNVSVLIIFMKMLLKLIISDKVLCVSCTCVGGREKKGAHTNHTSLPLTEINVQILTASHLIFTVFIVLSHLRRDIVRLYTAQSHLIMSISKRDQKRRCKSVCTVISNREEVYFFITFTPTCQIKRAFFLKSKKREECKAKEMCRSLCPYLSHSSTS